MAKVVLKLLETASGQVTEFDGKYLVFYDPTYVHPGGYDGGLLKVSGDISLAMQFSSAAAALEKWRESFGKREDGELNRPLTAWTIEILPVEEIYDKSS